MTAIFTFFGHSKVLMINLVVRNGAFWDNQKKTLYIYICIYIYISLYMYIYIYIFIYIYIYIYTKISKILELFHVSKTNPLIYKIKNSSFL